MKDQDGPVGCYGLLHRQWPTGRVVAVTNSGTHIDKEARSLPPYNENDMTRCLPLLIVCAAILAWVAPPAAAQAMLMAAQSDTHGEYLTDRVGRPVYLFTADTQGAGEAKAVSNCHDACAQAWPPLITEGKPQAGTRVQASLLGTMQRQDGTTQVTYNGWPLYYFARDKPQGQPTGHDVQGFGGEWYLIQPQGTKVAEK